MGKRWKSKKKLEDDATYKSSNSSEEHDSDLEAGEKSPSTDNDTVYKEAKTAKRLTSKRRKLVISCTSSEHSRAAEVVVSNEDLLIEILFLVPAKSLLKFKSVSKRWRSLISDSKFASNHACRNPSSFLISGLYFYQRPWLTKELNSVSLHDHPSLPTLAFLDPVLEGSECRVVDSCNGLLLFSNRGNMEYIVCNPTTQKYIALPEHGGSRSSVYFREFSAFLAFDPSKSPYYKVVLVNHWGYEERSNYRLFIYSSKSAFWKEMDVKAPYGLSYKRMVFWNGAFHWMSHDYVHIQFDIDSEILTFTPMPKVPNILYEDQFLYFGECGGSLVLIQTRDDSAMGFRILEMKKDCSRWIVKCRVNLRPMGSVFHEGYGPKYGVLCCVKGANEKDFTLVLVIPGKVIAYNVNSKTVKVLLDLHGACYKILSLVTIAVTFWVRRLSSFRRGSQNSSILLFELRKFVHPVALYVSPVICVVLASFEGFGVQEVGFPFSLLSLFSSGSPPVILINLSGHSHRHDQDSHSQIETLEFWPLGWSRRVLTRVSEP